MRKGPHFLLFEKTCSIAGLFIFSLLFFGGTHSAFAQMDFDLPDPLQTRDGKEVKTQEQWKNTRRPEILELFRQHVYGRAPVGTPEDFRVANRTTSTEVMSGALRKQVELTFSGPGGTGTIELLLFLPEKQPPPVPVFLLICHRDRKNIDPSRQNREDFWPAERIVRNGYAAATFHVSDVDPDTHHQSKNGVHGIFDQYDGQRPGDAWGTIAAWAWGASRVMDYVEEDQHLDENHTAVVGHSRGGKASLWAGARDQRFDMVVSNASGCTGAALARRKVGERIKDINTNFPHWFCKNYRNYNGREDQLPVDQHLLIALQAPRLTYVASASKDNWADPKGEFLSCVHASPVYRLFGHTGLGTDEMPDPDQPIHTGRIGYHIRSGNHDMTGYDWKQFLKFAKMHWKR